MISRIQAVEFSALNVPLREPFGIAGGTHADVANVLVCVRLADGTTGYGEAAPMPAYNGETQEGTLAALGVAGPAIGGMDAREWRSIAARLREVIPRAGAARCAIETAALDAMLKQRGLPMYAFFGGAEQHLETDVTITTGSEEEASVAASRWAEAGFRTLKVKVGGGDLGHDIARIAAIRGAAPNVKILLDANASLSASAAIRVVQQLKQRGIEIELFEQPTPVGDWTALDEVAKHTIVAADENVVSAADALQAARLGHPHVINIKLMKAGIAEALDVAAIARAAGMRLMIGGNVESILSMTVSACFAAGQGGFSYIDLDTPLFLATNPFQGGFTARGPRIDVPVAAAGHGVIPAA